MSAGRSTEVERRQRGGGTGAGCAVATGTSGRRVLQFPGRSSASVELSRSAPTCRRQRLLRAEVRRRLLHRGTYCRLTAATSDCCSRVFKN